MKDDLTYQALCKIAQKFSEIRNKTLKQHTSRLLSMKDLDVNEIIKNFSFKTMQEECANSCYMLKKNKVCHNMETTELNCFGCYCPNYQIEVLYDNDLQKYKVGKCKINSKFGVYKLSKTRTKPSKEYLVLNCTNCTIPHNKVFLRKIIKNALNNSIN